LNWIRTTIVMICCPHRHACIPIVSLHFLFFLSPANFFDEWHRNSPILIRTPNLSSDCKCHNGRTCNPLSIGKGEIIHSIQYREREKKHCQPPAFNGDNYEVRLSFVLPCTPDASAIDRWPSKIRHPCTKKEIEGQETFGQSPSSKVSSAVHAVHVNLILPVQACHCSHHGMRVIARW